MSYQPTIKSDIRTLIHSAAEKNAKYVKPWRSLEDRDDNNTIQDDAIVISKRKSTNEYDVYSTRPKKEDFGIRIRTVCDYIKSVVPMCENDVSGCYRVSYDDMIYEKDDTNCLVFSKYRDQQVALMPDMYQMANYSGKGIDLAKDTYPFEAKLPATVFVGSSTGHQNPLENERIQACLWSLSGNRDIAKCHITHVCQMSQEDLVDSIGHSFAKRVLSAPMFFHDQIKYQSVLSIDGNTCAWDRPIWVMGSNSILFKKSSNMESWYYPYWKPKEHYVDIQEWNSIRPNVHYYHNNPNERRLMIDNCRTFLKDYIDVPSGKEYTCKLFDTIAELYKP